MTVYSRQLLWRELRPGISAIIILFLVALLILVRMGVGSVPGEKFTIYARSAEARGILKGSDIWLAGMKVGAVSGVTFLPPDSVRSTRLLLELRILDEYRELISRNSHAQVRRGTRLIGNPVLHLSVGMPSDPMINAGDTIITLAQFDAEAVAARADQAMQAFPLIMRDINQVVQNTSGIDSLLRAFISPGDSAGALRPLRALVNAITDLGRVLEVGTVGLLRNEPAFGSRISSINTSMDSLLRLYDLTSSPGGRYLTDAALFDRIDSVAQKFETVSASIAARYADVSRGARAQALATEIARLNASLRALREDARKHPFRYFIF